MIPILDCGVMWKVIVIAVTCLPITLSLECYVCTNQDSNEDKCTKTIKTCNITENRCLSEIRWGSTPYWDATGKKQFYITKSCASEKRCKGIIEGVSTRCDRIWYNDWECAECCHGDRCNYYVTLAGESHHPYKVLYVFLSIAWFVIMKLF